MTPENKQIPDWARNEREHDLAWIDQNLHVFWPLATAASEKVGHGAIVVDTTSQPISSDGHPFWYFSKAELEEYDVEDVKRLVREYEPPGELVLMLLKSENRTSSYRLRPQPGSNQESGAT